MVAAGFELLSRARKIEPSHMPRAVAPSKAGHRGAWALHAERRVAARLHPATRIEHVVAQHDVLARNVWLVRAAAVIATDDAAVGRRALRPVDPVAVKRQLLRRVIARWQTCNERRDLPGHWIHGHNARAVVVPRRSQRLVRSRLQTSGHR